MGRPDAKAPEISVVVPARNAEALLPRFAAAVLSQSLDRSKYEVLLADDGSEDATAATARELGLDGVIRFDSHVGPYVARNAAAREARGQVLAFTDVDCEPAPDWLERGGQRFSDPSLELMSGGFHVPLGEPPGLAELVDASHFVNPRQAASKGFALGGNMWMRRSRFERLGGFNERLTSGGDQELTKRAVSHGAELAYAPDVRVSHPPHTSIRKLVRKAWRIGQGAAHQRRLATGPMRPRPLICKSPRNYLPWPNAAGLERLEELGAPLPAHRRPVLAAASYLLLQLPMVLGNLYGALRRPAPEPLLATRRELLRTLRTARYVARNPGELRHLAPWLRSLLDRRSPLEQRRPWLPFSAQEWLARTLTPDMEVFEYGSGGSTLFIAPRVRRLVSVEHDREWHERVARELSRQHGCDCSLLLREPESGNGSQPSYDGYVAAIDGYPDHGFDIVIVDGRDRLACIRRAEAKVRPGGYLVLDNADRPHYREAGELLARHQRTDLVGLVPARTFRGQTSVWRIA